MYMRLGFAIAAHIEADVLLLDEVFAVGDEAFQRKCFGKIFEFKQRGGTIVFVSHDASAVERLCDRAVLLREGEVAFDGPTHEAILQYRRLLAGESDPAERGAGLKEWGSGEARIAALRLLGPDGSERTQYAAGEPIAVALSLTAEQPLDPPRLTWELRDDSSLLLASGAQPLGELGWQSPGDLALRFEIEEPPLADGRFHLRFGLADAGGDRVYHWLDDALTFVVYPTDGARGMMRVNGHWSADVVAVA
jgi:hypothetical protein